MFGKTLKVFGSIGRTLDVIDNPTIDIDKNYCLINHKNSNKLVKINISCDLNCKIVIKKVNNEKFYIILEVIKYIPAENFLTVGSFKKNVVCMD